MPYEDNHARKKAKYNKEYLARKKKIKKMYRKLKRLKKIPQHIVAEDVDSQFTLNIWNGQIEKKYLRKLESNTK